MDSSQDPRPIAVNHQGVWVLVIALIILTLGLSVTVVWMAIASSQSWGDGGPGGIPYVGSNDRADDDGDNDGRQDMGDDGLAPSGDNDGDQDMGDDGVSAAPTSTVGAAFSRVLPVGVVDGQMPNIT